MCKHFTNLPDHMLNLNFITKLHIICQFIIVPSEEEER
jgi:hypothetical protein